MFTSLFCPKVLSEFVGNSSAITSFKQWLDQWPHNKKGALLSGPSGVGKSTLVNLILKEYGYHVIEFEEKTIGHKRTCDGRLNALVISDIDSLGDCKSISTFIKETEIPVVCICDNRWNPAIKGILPYCTDIKLLQPSYAEVYRLIYRVVVGERIRIKEPEIASLYEQAKGDIRFMLNALQLRKAYHSCKDLHSTNVFDTTSQLLSMDETLENKYQTYWLSHDLHPLMVQENYVNSTFNVRDEVRKLENLEASSHALSCADVLLNQWDTATYGAYSVIEATTTCNKKGSLKFPQCFGKKREKKRGYDSFSLFEQKTEVEKQLKKAKEPKTKEPKTKEPKTKEPKAKEPKAKRPKKATETKEAKSNQV